MYSTWVKLVYIPPRLHLCSRFAAELMSSYTRMYRRNYFTGTLSSSSPMRPPPSALSVAGYATSTIMQVMETQF